MKILYASKQLLGQRETQEDYIQLVSDSSKNQALLVLADGMGGHAGGEKASRLVVEAFINHYEQQQGSVVERLQQSLEAANDTLNATILAAPEYHGMGCTLIAVYIDDMQLYWISVGDSPFWLYRNQNLMRLNQDHSMAAVYARMVRMGEMTEEEARNEPMRNSLRSAIKGEEITIVDLPESHFSLQKDDILLLASDGLETLNTTQISTILKQSHHNMESLADNLIAAIKAENTATQDNTSVIVYKVSASNVSYEPWYTKNLRLCIVIAFSLSVLIIFALFQVKSDSNNVLDSPTKTHTIKSKTNPHIKRETLKAELENNDNSSPQATIKEKVTPYPEHEIDELLLPPLNMPDFETEHPNLSPQPPATLPSNSFSVMKPSPLSGNTLPYTPKDTIEPVAPRAITPPQTFNQ